MRPRDLVELLALAALWGGSFLLMRVAAPDFGPIALVFVRVAGASLLLLPLLVWRGELGALRRHWRPIFVVGLTNSALPFLLFTIAVLAISAGLASIMNATTPLWAALIAWAWMGERPTASRWVGLALGVAGVAGLALDKATLTPGAHGVSPALALAACLAAAALYGLSANFARARLGGVPPLAVAAGSQISATLALAGPALWAWPAATPSAGAWGAGAALAVACTALAYILYFRLIAHAGATNASTVTFLVPVFAVTWGAVLLDEPIDARLLAGCAVILLGTALTTGLLRLRRPRSR